MALHGSKTYVKYSKLKEKIIYYHPVTEWKLTRVMFSLNVFLSIFHWFLSTSYIRVSHFLIFFYEEENKKDINLTKSMREFQGMKTHKKMKDRMSNVIRTHRELWVWNSNI